jgi:iron-sulfur cluster repair protein YtfE (RIC family)
MMNLGWCAPSRRVDAQTARQNIRAQHDRIRSLLVRAGAVAEKALDGHSPSPDAVASAIGDIHTTITVHLAFEEDVLLPILDDDLPLGPERGRRLVEEHRRQRAMLEGLHREACVGPELPTLAAKLAFLTFWLLADMAEEERTFVTPEVIRDDAVSVDQDDG